MASENDDLYKYVLDFSPDEDGFYEPPNFYKQTLEAIPGFTTQPDYIANKLNILFSAGDGYNYKSGPLADKRAEPENPNIITNIEYNKGYHIYSCLKTWDPEAINDNLVYLNTLNSSDTSVVRILCFLDVTKPKQMKLFMEVFKGKFNFINTLDNRFYFKNIYTYPLLCVGGTIANIYNMISEHITDNFTRCFSEYLHYNTKSKKTITLIDGTIVPLHSYLIKKDSEDELCDEFFKKHIGGTRKLVKRSSKKRTTLRRRCRKRAHKYLRTV